jgi:hypothetical protein
MDTGEIRVQITVQPVTGAQEAQTVCASLLALLLRIAGYGLPLLPIPQPLMDSLLPPPLLLCTRKFLMIWIVQKHILQSAMMLVTMMIIMIRKVIMMMTTIKMKKQLMFYVRMQASIRIVSVLVSMMFFNFCDPICKLSSKHILNIVITCMCFCVEEVTPHYLSVDVEGRAKKSEDAVDNLM